MNWIHKLSVCIILRKCLTGVADEITWWLTQQIVTQKEYAKHYTKSVH